MQLSHQRWRTAQKSARPNEDVRDRSVQSAIDRAAGLPYLPDHDRKAAAPQGLIWFQGGAKAGLLRTAAALRKNATVRMRFTQRCCDGRSDHPFPANAPRTSHSRRKVGEYGADQFKTGCSMTFSLRRPLLSGILAGTVLSGLGAVSAQAQYYYPYPPPPPGPVYVPAPAYGAPVYGMLPPGEIRAIVRNLGYWQVSRPSLQGRAYVVSAVGDGGPVALAVDAFTGRVSPLTTVSGPTYGPPPATYAPMPRPPASQAARTPPATPPAQPSPKRRPADVQTAKPDVGVPIPPAPGAAIPAAPATAAPDSAATGGPATPPPAGQPIPSAQPAPQTPAKTGAAPGAGQAIPPAQTPPAQAPAAQAAPAPAQQAAPAAQAPATRTPAAGTATPGDVPAGSASVLSRGTN